VKRLVIVGVVLLFLVAAGAGTWAITSSSDDDDQSGTLGPAATGSASETGSGVPDAREAPSPELQEFYDQQLDWGTCEDDDYTDRECARIEVPLDYDDPTGATIELQLLKNEADEPAQRIGSLVVNPGGPGAPGTSYADYDDAFGQPLRDRFDIIGFDPRGTGSSSPVDCLSDRELDGYIAADPDPDTPDEVREFMGWADKLGQGCETKSGQVADHVSTHEAARDIDILRAVLDEKKLTYFGASYGTKLGATYADLFPERSGRLVLDGAVDVSLSLKDSSLQQAEGFEVALGAYVDDCVDSGGCYLGDSRPEALRTIKDFLAGVEDEPIPVGDRELAVGNAFYGIIIPLYNRDYWQALTDRLGAAMDGKAAGLLELSDLYSSRNEDGTYDDNSAEAIYAINCLDDPAYITAPRVPSQYADFEKASPTFGRVFAWGLTGCSGFDAEGTRADWDLDAAGADPLLVIGTTRDPATPLRWAKALAAQLDPAILVTRDGDGHTGYNMDNSCVDDVVESYLIDGDVPDADVDCPAP
jgi:pimeloyl-ACP methyl ester carboxylesterase